MATLETQYINWKETNVNSLFTFEQWKKKVFEPMIISALNKQPVLNYLDGWWFTYNGASEVWSACETENRNAVTNDYTSDKVLRGNTFETLRDLIIKHKGNLNEINKVYE